MAEETGTGGLAWVQEPAISEGKVVYKYKNSSDADAEHVYEGVTLFMPGSGGSSSQSFQVDGLAAGAEQETHAPVPSDLADGPIMINLQIQSSSGDAWVGELLYEVKAQIAGGALHPASDQSASDQPAAAVTLSVDARDVKLEGDELMIHYRITGDAHLDAVSIFVSLLDPQGGSGWMNSFIPQVDREDIFRTAIPFDEVMDSDTGWVIEAGITGADTQAEVSAHIRVHLPIERVDGTVVATEGWSSMSES